MLTRNSVLQFLCVVSIMSMSQVEGWWTQHVKLRQEVGFMLAMAAFKNNIMLQYFKMSLTVKC